MESPYRLSAQELLAEHGVDASQGLSAEQVERRREQHSFNGLIEAPSRGVWRILYTQLTQTLILVLIASAVRSERESVIGADPRKYRRRDAAVVGSTALQLMVIYWPPAQRLVDTVALSARDLGLCFAASAVILVAVEMQKAIKRLGEAGAAPATSAR